MPGVIYWASIDADQVPTGLTLPDDNYETQTQGGTWSERFDSESILNTNQVVGVIVWYLDNIWIWYCGISTCIFNVPKYG